MSVVKKAVIAVVALMLVLPAAWFAATRRRYDAAIERWVERAKVLDRTRLQRPAHVEPAEPGSVAARVVALGLPANAPWKVQLEPQVADVCGAVRHGQQPLSTLPAACRAQWQQHREWSLAVVRASRSGELTEPGAPQFGYFDGPLVSGLDVLPRQFALKQVVLEMWSQLAAGQGDEALALCLDGLAASRDGSLGHGLIGSMAATGTTHLLVPPCAAAIDGASSQARALATAGLERIVRGTPPVGSWLEYEQLVLGPLSMRSSRWQQPDVPLALQKAASEASDERGRLDWLAELFRPEALEQYFADVGAAMVLHGDERQAALSSAAVTFPLTGETVSVGYDKFVKREEERVADLALLQWLLKAKQVRATSGAWPTDTPAGVKVGENVEATVVFTLASDSLGHTTSVLVLHP